MSKQSEPEGTSCDVSSILEVLPEEDNDPSPPIVADVTFRRGASGVLALVRTAGMDDGRCDVYTNSPDGIRRSSIGSYYWDMIYDNPQCNPEEREWMLERLKDMATEIREWVVRPQYDIRRA